MKYLALLLFLSFAMVSESNSSYSYNLSFDKIFACLPLDIGGKELKIPINYITHMPTRTRELSSLCYMKSAVVSSSIAPSAGAQCIGPGNVMLTKPGLYIGCGNIGQLTISGSDIIVKKIHAINIRFDKAENSLVTDSIVEGSGVYVARSRNIVFENNSVLNTIGLGMDIRPQELSGLIVRNNLFSGLRRSGRGQAGRDHGAGIIVGHYWKDSSLDVNPMVMIEYNRFDNFDSYGDAMSAIHIKSNGVIVQNNNIDAVNAMITVRHGRNAYIADNIMSEKTQGIRIMGDDHTIIFNNVPEIRIFGGSATMDDYNVGENTGGGKYPVARNIRLIGNSVKSQVACYGKCPLRPTYVEQ